MNKYVRKPVVAVLTIATLIGGFTPVLASNYDRTSVKVVMPEETREQQAFLEVNTEVKGEVTYLSGKVSDEVSRVVIVKPNNDKIAITQFSNGSFTVSIPTVESDAPRYVSLFAFSPEEEVLEIRKIPFHSATKPASGEEAIFDFKATLIPKNKQVHISGSIKSDDAKGLELFAVAPDGIKHPIKLDQQHQFEAFLSYKNRSFHSKAVLLELYQDGKLVTKAEIAHGVPNNSFGKAKKETKQEEKIVVEKGHQMKEHKHKEKKDKDKKDKDKKKQERDND